MTQKRLVGAVLTIAFSAFVPWSMSPSPGPLFFEVGISQAACGGCESNSVTSCLIDDKKEEEACDPDAAPPPNGCPEIQMH